jgi:hypothetical protein
MTSLARALPIGSVTQATVTGGAPTRGRGAITRRVLDAAALSRGDRVTLADLFDRLGPEGLGLALLLLTLPTLIPVPGPIGMTFGTLIAFVALQVMVGRRVLWLPAILRRRTLPGSVLRGVIARALPGLSYAERWLREGRLAPLAGRRAGIVLAIPLLLLAAAITLPIPLGNYAPALALIAFSLGFMARDGAAILVALLLGIAALVWTGVLFLTGAALLDHLLGLVGW